MPNADGKEANVAGNGGYPGERDDRPWASMGDGNREQMIGMNYLEERTDRIYIQGVFTYILLKIFVVVLNFSCAESLLRCISSSLQCTGFL